ncbi:MAG TPA: DUF3175 domain-containing protein [Gemmatimonadaceae bacterium]|nr:DUF3175 domain-containing protein [Gemmatimonadaceae bacterium]
MTRRSGKHRAGSPLPGRARRNLERSLIPSHGMPRARRKRSPSNPRRRPANKRWSGYVTKHSNALDLDRSVFTWKDPHRIARSLKRSADRSHRRKSDPYRSAMSMLTFYINRAGKNLGARQKGVLERAKTELRKLYKRPA